MEVLRLIYLFFSVTVADSISKLSDGDEFDGALSFVSDRNRLWRNGFIPYLFRDDRYSGRRYEPHEKEMVRNVMARITIQLGPDCIKFLEVESCSGHDSCLRFDKKTLDQCKATIGSSNDSYVTLESPHCFEDNGNIIMHELGHVFGLVHEQNRPDRDQFITIHDDFLDWGAKFQMKIREGYGEIHQSPYDYFSIMHYTRTMGCQTNKTCIELKQPYLDVFTSNGQTILESYPDELSPVDIYEISQAYNCSMKSKSVKKYAHYLKTILTAPSLDSKGICETCNPHCFVNGNKKFTKFGDALYHYSDNPTLYWMEAERECSDMLGLNGHLTSIGSREEYNFIIKEFEVNSPVHIMHNIYIGALQTIPGDYTSYIWTDGTPMNLEFLNTLWLPGQPDNSGDGSDGSDENVIIFWNKLNSKTQQREIGLNDLYMRSYPLPYLCKFNCSNK